MHEECGTGAGRGESFWGQHIMALEEIESKFPSDSTIADITWTIGGHEIQAVVLLRGKPEVGVLDVSLPKGVVFPAHFHEHSVETIMCYKGKIKYVSPNRTRILVSGDCVHIPKNNVHKITALEDSWAIVVGIPRPQGFSDER